MSKNNEEEWKDIEGYEGIYQVSNLGRVKALGRAVPRRDGGKPKVKEEMIRKLCPTPAGYVSVMLKLAGTKKINPGVHRLVAKAFIANPEHKPEVNHKNGIRDDNHVENLEWATPSENIQHAIRTGLLPTCENSTRSRLTNAVVERIFYLASVGLTTTEIGRIYAVEAAHVSAIIRNKIWKNHPMRSIK